MNDELVERLLDELSATRQSFDAATAQIKWNRRNTIIQYILIAVVLIMLFGGLVYYLDDQKASCEHDNDLRISISNSLDSNAWAIGVALAVVSNASDETFREYMEVYGKQDKPQVLELRDC